MELQVFGHGFFTFYMSFHMCPIPIRPIQFASAISCPDWRRFFFHLRLIFQYNLRIIFLKFSIFFTCTHSTSSPLVQIRTWPLSFASVLSSPDSTKTTGVPSLPFPSQRLACPEVVLASSGLRSLHSGGTQSYTTDRGHASSTRFVVPSSCLVWGAN